MAATNTTLASACPASATSINVASASGFGVGNLILVEQELMQQTAAASGTIVAVRRGLDGGVQSAHAASAFVTTSATPGDFPGPAPGQNVTYGPMKPDGMQEAWNYYTYSAAGAISPVSGVHVINGSGALAMTLAGPTGPQEGAVLVIESKNLHANTITATPAYLGAAGTGIATAAATGANLVLKASGGKWTVIGVSGVTFT
jgi:hypothetical protein